MSTAANKDLVRKSVEALNAGDVEQFIDCFAPNYVHHDPSSPDITDRETLRAFVEAQGSVFPDRCFTIEDLVSEGDKVTKRWSCTGTHKGEMAGIPPTNNQVTVHATSIYRIENGKFVEGWFLLDNLGVMQQIGAIPAAQEQVT